MSDSQEGKAEGGRRKDEIRNPASSFILHSSSSSVVSPTAVIGSDVRVAAFVYIGERVHIGTGTIIEPNVTILDECELGARVRIGAGTVIGAEGFGYTREPATDENVKCPDTRHPTPGTPPSTSDAQPSRSEPHTWTHIPHTGKVVIEDDVEIGANCTIARAKTQVTRIGAGTKIDSLVHIAHNVTIGRNCIIIAQVGIAGSARIGDNVILAGQVGIKDHVSVGHDSVVYAKSALYRSIPPNSHYSGNPARPHRENLAALAQIRRIARGKRGTTNPFSSEEDG
jgi:UDP-3-O-[3-hydroxymyristoyl] glucosamine N-acyltransferase